jgi:type VI secretion system protein ImpC
MHLVASLEPAGGAPPPDTPFRVAVLGDFGARVGAGARRLVEIDRDNFDDVLRSLGVGLRLRLSDSEPGEPLALAFEELEDFHPDRIYDRLEIFQSLRRTRRRLEDPSTFDAASAEVRAWARHVAASPPPTPGRTDDARQGRQDEGGFARDLIEELLNAPQGAAAVRHPEGLSDLNGFLREIVRPHVTPSEDARKPELIDAVDAAAGRLMRAVLHHTDFQRLEAAWRALHLLVSKAETGATLKLYLLNLSREELAEGLRTGEGERAGSLQKLLVEESVATWGGEPWSLLLGDYTFEPTRVDAGLLSANAGGARQAGAPVVAAAGPRVAGCESFAATPDPDDWRRPEGDDDARAWAELRRSPEARHLGLAAPRFLLRLPYGRETEPAERFNFEEFEEGVSRHEDYLWGNPAFLCGHLLAEAFSRSGWGMRPGEVKEVGGLPLHVLESDGESQAKPCGEAFLTERAAEGLLERGVMPLLSFKHGDTVRLARFQSLADPASELAGRWPPAKGLTPNS